MKTIFKLTSILCLFFAISCGKGKSVEKPTSDETLSGKWKLIETLADPGNGSGKWRAVDHQTPPENILFKEDGTLEWNVDKDFKTYTKTDSTILSFVRADKSTKTFYYKIKIDTLILSPQCIEACGSKYVKIK